MQHEEVKLSIVVYNWPLTAGFMPVLQIVEIVQLVVLVHEIVVVKLVVSVLIRATVQVVEVRELFNHLHLLIISHRTHVLVGWDSLCSV